MRYLQTEFNEPKMSGDLLAPDKFVPRDSARFQGSLDILG